MNEKKIYLNEKNKQKLDDQIKLNGSKKNNSENNRERLINYTKFDLCVLDKYFSKI